MTRALPSLSATLRAAGILCLASLLPVSARAASPGQALVIGEAIYTSLPALQACALSAHSVAAALRRIGFSVDEQDDASSGAIFAGVAALAHQLQADPAAPVFVYMCSYATAFDGRPFMLPVSAAISRPADILTQGVLSKTLVDAVTRNTSAPAVVALDAIPLQKGDNLALDRLNDGLPPTLGLVAVHDAGPANQPTPLAALLAPMLKGPAVQSGKLLADLQPQLSAEPAAKMAALHLPADGLYLAGAPASPTARAAGSPIAGSTASPSQAMTAPPPARPAVPVAPAQPAAPAPAAPAASSAATLPDEAQMTGAQRRTVQQALTKLGYYDGRIDGIFGADTRAAIRRWQHELHAPMTGHLTALQATLLVGG